jgi:segregation and condensation protein B
MPEDPNLESTPSLEEESVSVPLQLEEDEGPLALAIPTAPDQDIPPSAPVSASFVSSEAFSEGDELDLEEASLPRPDDEILLEAALFASTELLTLRHLRELVDPTLTAPKIQKLVTSINQRLLEGRHPFEVVSAAGGWRLRTKPELYPWLRGLFKEVQNRRLSQAVLETLAVVAYKQPITKAEIEAVRGVSADGALKKLLEKKLVTVSGRTDTPGRPLTYGTTREFLEYFGISKLPDDLPRLAEFEELVQSRSLLPQVAPGGVLLQAEQQEE